MRAKLYAKHGELKGRSFDIAGEATIGRSPDNAIALSSKGISKRHARIAFDADSGRYYLEDLDSLNGTELDGVPVKGRERLGHLHVISLAGSELIFQDLHLCRGRHETGVEPLAPPEREVTMVEEAPLGLPEALNVPGGSDRPAEHTLVEQAAVQMPVFLTQKDAAGQEATPPPSFFVEITDLDGAVRRCQLQQGENLVGRARGAQVRIRSTEVSRRHAVLSLNEDTVTLRDEGSANHTFLDDKRVDGETEVPPDARLRFGSVRARLIRSE